MLSQGWLTLGSARHRSWSHSRQETYDRCPRSLYFQYFPWGDPDQNLARFLRRAVTPERLAGTIIHDMVVLGLRTLVRRQTYPLGLAANGIAKYDEAIRDSLRIAKIVKKGTRPPDEGVCLFHHLYGVEDVAGESRGREIVECCLTAFETSSALEFLKTTNFDRWERILTDTDNIPSFIATADLGFEGAAGLRVYAAYDLAFRHGDDFILIDWKTGSKSGRSLLAARRQLAVYGLWAMSRGIPLDRIKVQVYWLQDGEQWDPQPLNAEDVANALRQIEEHDTVEREATTPIPDRNGEIVKYEADRDAFPAQPDVVKCGWCPYRAICDEGRAALSLKERRVA